MNGSPKNKVLELIKIFIKYTDEEHPISMREILAHMDEECGKDNGRNSCSEDSILRYIKQIENSFGLEIIYNQGRNASYFLADRLLEKEEMRLIFDAVNASNFIEKEIANRICCKLKKTMSQYEVEELDNNILGATIAKAENKRILYNVNKIREAFNKNVQISFNYMGWNKERKILEKKKLNGEKYKYNMSPWALIWADDRYYLFGYDVRETEAELMERNYRVDKLSNIKLSDMPRGGGELFKRFDANTYVSRRMGMFSGKEEIITVEIPEQLIGAFIDQFGKTAISVTETAEGKLSISFTAVPSPILLGWFIGLKNVKVIKPQKVKDDIVELLKKNTEIY